MSAGSAVASPSTWIRPIATACWRSSTTATARKKHVWRARIALATADGLGTSAIMRAAGVRKKPSGAGSSVSWKAQRLGPHRIRTLQAVHRSEVRRLRCCDDNAGSVRYAGIHAALLLALFARSSRLFARGDGNGACARGNGWPGNLVWRRGACRWRPRSGASRCRSGHPASSWKLPRPRLRAGSERTCGREVAAPAQPNLRAARAKPHVAVGRSSLEAAKGLRRAHAPAAP
jgi:hypothetical protein